MALLKFSIFCGVNLVVYNSHLKVNRGTGQSLNVKVFF